MKQIESAERLMTIKYPNEDGWRIVWIFDHISCHSAMVDNGKLMLNHVENNDASFVTDTLKASKVTGYTL